MRFLPVNYCHKTPSPSQSATLIPKASPIKPPQIRSESGEILDFTNLISCLPLTSHAKIYRQTMDLNFGIQFISQRPKTQSLRFKPQEYCRHCPICHKYHCPSTSSYGVRRVSQSLQKDFNTTLGVYLDNKLILPGNRVL